MNRLLSEDKNVVIKLEDRILIAKWYVTHVDLKTAKELVELRIKVTEGKSYATVADVSSLQKLTKDAREFMASEDAYKGIIALAVLTNSPIAGMIGNFWMRINKPLIPTKLFNDLEAAKKWLVTFVNA